MVDRFPGQSRGLWFHTMRCTLSVMRGFREPIAQVERTLLVLTLHLLFVLAFLPFSLDFTAISGTESDAYTEGVSWQGPAMNNADDF